jgi:hypothetical protein
LLNEIQSICGAAACKVLKFPTAPVSLVLNLREAISSCFFEADYVNGKFLPYCCGDGELTMPAGGHGSESVTVGKIGENGDL